MIFPQYLQIIPAMSLVSLQSLCPQFKFLHGPYSVPGAAIRPAAIDNSRFSACLGMRGPPLVCGARIIPAC